MSGLKRVCMVLFITVLVNFVNTSYAVDQQTYRFVTQTEVLVLQNAYKAYQLGYSTGSEYECTRILTAANIAKKNHADEPEVAEFLYQVYAGICYNACLDGVDARRTGRDLWRIDYKLLAKYMYEWGCKNYGVCH